ncbi:MAG: ribonuclease P protein component [Gemmatimonadetes bacterium]|nr:ribonuclease P protein component [Gemmatimonadota bacterium]
MAVQRGRGRKRLPCEARIRKSGEIRALFQRGKKSRTAHLDVFDSPSPAVHPRVGVVVPRHRHSAVQRNRLKRRIREILRQVLLPSLRDAGLRQDVLVRARAEAYGAPFAELRTELVDWWERRWPRRPSWP